MTAGEHVECDFGGSLQVDELIAGQQHMAKCRPKASVGWEFSGRAPRIRSRNLEQRRRSEAVAGRPRRARRAGQFVRSHRWPGWPGPSGQPAAGRSTRSLLSRNRACGATVVLARSPVITLASV
ncbi:MAG: hypothetical protein Ct9H300mP1_37650 [Planctomycetaceae bacterium]|nr:MAG: hypothetical protein Ct9H300mP1_37650 [Planctomycetaceae bacterium]